MVKGIVFDLDNCIFDTRSMGEDVIDPVLKPVTSSDLPREIKRGVAEALWTTALEDVIDQYRLPPEVAEKMREACRTIEIPKERSIKTFGDEQCIADLPVKKYLVTSGYRKFQQSKIDRLHIAGLFDEIIINDADYREERKGKVQIFKEILETEKWDTSEVLVVGDNPKSELGAARAVGVKCVQILRPQVIKWNTADYHIESLCELRFLL